MGPEDLYGVTDHYSLPQTASSSAYDTHSLSQVQYYPSSQYQTSNMTPDYYSRDSTGGNQAWIESTATESTHYRDFSQTSQYRPGNMFYYREPAANYHSSSSSGSDRGSVESLPETIPTQQTKHLENVRILRHILNIPDDVPVNLNALPDSPPGVKPKPKLATLVQVAIIGSPNHRLSLREISSAIQQRFEFFRDPANQSWKESIRHLLSLKRRFLNVPRPITEPGSGSYWMVDMTLTGDKRPRKRKSRNSQAGRDQSADSRDHESFDDTEDRASPARSQDGASSHMASSGSNTARARARTSPYTPSNPTRYSPHRIQSNPEINSMNMGGDQQQRSFAYANAPPVQGLYHGSWSNRHHLQSTAPQRQFPPTHYPNPAGPDPFGAPGVPRPSFHLPPLPQFAPGQSAPTHEVLGIPPGHESTPSPPSSTSSQSGPTTNSARIIAHPPSSSSSSSSSHRSGRSTSQFDRKGKGRGI
ncbi:hypothetical protein GYMLUDRAFT_200817 [Collybiopsis luxurians FD-317 M1]|uniref:Unplaced genomic scaffold GYMLUscaffold_28, whole genome shotgun sequence n=1 Tax=Collybiopsis luxurians FD-317 M1 TaxID=944289 RepID=A0A0D0CNA9_9AGAR|nr:hypothetical protein GYMLUDRAFT_200817 [Collybiopsis luxurians FD-317 M1]